MPQSFETLFPDYRSCIANLPNSVMKAFGVEPVGETLPLLDGVLKDDYRNVVVILLDGMGLNIIEHLLAPEGFFRSHFAGACSSTFPPTTVAATTSILSGLQPVSHAWLGWDCYYPQIDQNVTVFTNNLQDSDQPAADYNVAGRYTPYESVFDRFARQGKHAYAAMPFLPPYPDTFEQILGRIAELCRRPERKYIYAYWNEPDLTMHQFGCYSREAAETLRDLEARIAGLCRELPNTLVVVTADHGQIDTKCDCITRYPTLVKRLVRMPSIEPRALNLFVREGEAEPFAAEFRQLFGDEFLLLTMQEVLDRKLFGDAEEHPCFRAMLGDYLAVAVGERTLFNTELEAERFRGVHAGMTAEEMQVPLILHSSAFD